jgi:hypothetical protein
MMPTTSGISISIWMTSCTAVGCKIEEIVERITAEELSKHILGISEHKREARSENEVMGIEWISSSSTMMMAAFIVIYQALLSILIINSTLFLCKIKITF